MANYLITNYAKWQKLSEAQSPGKTKQTAGMGQRVVGIPVNQQSFKIKIIQDLNVTDSAGKLTDSGWKAILNWIKQQPKWLPYYPGLGDLKNNFVIYSINKDTDRKQLITFTISPRTAAPGLPENVQIVRKEDIATVISDASKAKVLADTSATASNTQVDTKTPAAQTSQIKLADPLTFEQLKSVSSNQPVFTAFKNAYLNMWKKPEFANLAVMPKLKSEIKEAGKLGDAAVALAKGIIAGFNLVDEYDDDIKVVDQQVIDKLALFTTQPTAQNSSRKYFLGLGVNAVYEQTIMPGQEEPGASGEPTAQGQVTTGLPAGFDLAAFISAVEQGAASSEQALGDIKLPEGGLKKGSVAKGDTELKKFQELVIKTFAKKLAGDELYKKFAGFGADGDYGPTTEKMVGKLKKAFELPDKDGTTITAELITKINTNKIDEGVYLGLNSKLVEQFNMEAYNEPYTPVSKKKEAKKEEPKKEETKKDGSVKLTTADQAAIQEIIKGFGAHTELQFTTDTKEPVIYFKGAKKAGIDYGFIFNNSKVKYVTSAGRKYWGKYNSDTSKVKFDNGKEFSLEDVASGKVGDILSSQDSGDVQGKKAYIAKDGEGFVNVRRNAMVTGSNLIYKHEDKSKPIGLVISTAVAKSTKIGDKTWYKVQFPEKVKASEYGWVRSDTVDLKSK
jgi:hypothetical protein